MKLSRGSSDAALMPSMLSVLSSSLWSELEIANFSTHGEFLTPLNSLGFLLPRQFTKITKRVRSREPQA